MAMSSEEMYVVEPKNNPQAVFDYFYNSDESGKSRSVRDVQMQAKQHLAAMGWSFHYIIKKPGKRELRYCPPDSKKKYISLRMACKGFLDSQSQLGASVLGPKNVERTLDHDVLESVDNAVELESGKANVNASTSKKRRLSSGDVYGERMLACMKGRVEDDPLVEDTLSEEENFAEFYKDLCRESEPDSEKVSGGTESQETSSNDLFVPERKDTKVSKRGRKRKAGGRGRSGGKLALFLKSGMIKPLAKVYYRKKDGSVMGEGRVTSEGVDCSCCEGVFNLSHFESHVKSTYHRPAAHIFLEDGRSLMQIEQEMGALDNKVKGIKTKGNESKNGSVSETMHQKPHDDFCLVCREPGDLILCDQCTSAFHPKCLGLSEVPASEFWYCPTCCCTICGQKGPGDDSEPTNTCDQCEQQFHVKCIGQYGVADSERKKWFCSEKCKGISAGLGELLGKTFVVGDNNLSWTILKNVENVINVKTTRKLNQALTVMHECFQSVKEPWNGRDVAEDVIFSRSSEVKRLDYRGFYTVILEKRAEVVTVATVRIFGDKVAEVPLIATRFQYRRLGMCKTLMDVLEQKLSNLGVEKVVLPAISSVVDTWTSPAFGFTVMTTYERSKLRNYTLLSFPDNVTCQKLLGGSGQSFPGNCSQDQDSLFEVGICSLVDKNQMPSL